MAKTPKEPAVIDEGLDITDVWTAAELNPALAQIYSELGGDAQERVTVYISKIDEKTGKDQRIWNGMPDDYDLMGIAKRFGSGDYRVKVYAPTERGNPGMRVNQIIPILLDPAEDARIAAQRRGELPATGAVVPLTEQRVAEIVAQALRSNAPVVAPAVDPLAMVERLAGVMAKLMPQAPATQVSGITETFGVMRSAMSLMRDMRGGDDLPRDGDGKVDREGVMWSKGLDLLQQILTAKNGGQAIQPQQPNESQEVQLNGEQMAALEEMRTAIRFAVRAAKGGQQPEEFAAEAYEYVPLEMIAEFYTDPQWYEKICGAVPDAAKHKEFFAKVRAQLIAFAQEDKLLTADGKIVHAADDLTTDGANGITDAGNVTAAGGSTAGKP